MNFFVVAILFLILGVASPFARVVEDSRNRFVLDDIVLESSIHACNSNKDRGAMFLPENAAYLDGNSMPFRHYRVALPSRQKPSVSVTDQKTVPLNKPLCKGGPGGEADVLKFLPVSVSEPMLRDGLWMTDIRVPLYVKNAGSVSLRKNFRLTVSFAGTAQGVNPGDRALSRVKNPKAASRFGVSKANTIRALRKSASASSSDATFLAKFQVGDKNVANNSEDGLYAVDYKTIRNALLAWQRQDELDGIPVDRICLYGASPDTLAEMGPGTRARNPNQIFEIPIEIRDHSSSGNKADGIFGDGDTLFFVGYGNAFWKRVNVEDPTLESGRMDYFHSYSPYSFYQYFLLGYKDSGKGFRFSQKVSAPSGSGKDVAWMRYVRVEQDALLRDSYFGKPLDWESSSGKEWFWLWHSRFDTTSVNLNADGVSRLPGLVAGGKQFVSVSYFPHRSVWKDTAVLPQDQKADVYLSSHSYEDRMTSINFTMDVNGTRMHRSEMTLLPGGNFRMDNPRLKENGNRFNLEMLPNDRQYDRFDGYSVAYQWNPVVDSAEWLLPGAVSGIINVPVPSNVQVLKFVDMKPVGFLSASNGVAKDEVSLDTDVRYLAVRSGVYRSGLKVEGLPLHDAGLLTDLSRPNSKLEYLIITPAEFAAPAKSLAEFRSDGSASATYATSVVAVEDIYNRYTGGRMSPVAIRNYISYVYSVCPNLRYVLLIGAATYDYRGFNSKLSATYMPSFEKEDAVVEDFFAALDSGEICLYGKYDLDVALGRLPVSSASELSAYIEKVKDYEKRGVMDFSDWRSTLLHTADDARNNGATDNTEHTKFQEEVVRSIDEMSKLKGERWNFKKIYLLEYPEDAAGQKKDAAENFINILNQGALFTTYFGHGSKTDWAAEGLLKPSYISKLSNKGRYTILASFSCTVGRFDEGNARSLSEEFLLTPHVGSIASIGATRETFADYNSKFGKNLLLNALTNNGETIGMAMLSTKREVGLDTSRQRYNNERYVLLGEPVIQMPSKDLKITLDTPIDTVKALDRMTLSGSVQGMDDGYINLVLREGRLKRRISLEVREDSLDIFYDGALIYSEKIPVKGGRFTTEFVTPRKISIGDTTAEFSAWAYTSKSPSVGKSWIRDLVIGGISNYADSLDDTIPPSIEVRSCYAGGVSTPFADGETVKLQSPACLEVVVEDSTAIDYREQADEGVTFEVVGVQDPFHPWPFLEQTSKRAKVRMNFSTEQYPAGKYLFKVAASDVLDNRAVKTLQLEITDDMKAGLADVFNVPNPMGKKGTTFYFKNLAVDRESKVNIFIYNQNGKLVRVLKDAVSGVTHWNGHDNHGRLLANGLYHYVVRSEVPASGSFGKKTWTKKQKLLISR
ncbi:C25 family cysteine peptidase [Fibrobacter sp.]|uniref:C25 family cysteine peptidase n=1 Tax=Fibrobacter sp. TaxID=35828 RepID=UPI00388D1DB7